MTFLLQGIHDLENNVVQGSKLMLSMFTVLKAIPQRRNITRFVVPPTTALHSWLAPVYASLIHES